jgi:hypothetical protein
MSSIKKILGGFPLNKIEVVLNSQKIKGVFHYQNNLGCLPFFLLVGITMKLHTKMPGNGSKCYHYGLVVVFFY